ncbi:MAG: hypothetical protein ACFE0I_02410 [Elainellaceae cyanobacterium]
MNYIQYSTVKEARLADQFFDPDQFLAALKILGYEEGEIVYGRVLPAKDVVDAANEGDRSAIAIVRQNQKNCCYQDRESKKWVGYAKLFRFRGDRLETKESGEYKKSALSTWEWLKRQNLLSFNGIYFHPNKGGSKKIDITTLTSIFIERDNKTEEEVAQSNEKIEKLSKTLGQEPSLSLQSRQGPHVYWVLENNHKLSGDAWVTYINSAIKVAGSDGSIKDESRVMRAPGFNHWWFRNGKLESFPVKITHLKEDVKITEENLKRLPDAPEAKTRSKRQAKNYGESKSKRVFDAVQEAHKGQAHPLFLIAKHIGGWFDSSVDAVRIQNPGLPEEKRASHSSNGVLVHPNGYIHAFSKTGLEQFEGAAWKERKFIAKHLWQRKETLTAEQQAEVDEANQIFNQKELEIPSGRKIDRVKGFAKERQIVSYVPGQLPHRLDSSDAPITYQIDRDQQVAFYLEAERKGWKHVLNTSYAGCGKSNAIARLADAAESFINKEKEIEPLNTWYWAADHRNPTNQVIEENFYDFPARNNGYKVDRDRITETGQPYLVHPKEAENREKLEMTEGNCHWAELFTQVQSKNIRAVSRGKDNPICGACPFNVICGDIEKYQEAKEHGTTAGWGYKAEHKLAMQNAMKLRGHPTSAPEPYEKVDGEDKGMRSYDRTIVVWDEAAQLFTADGAVEVNQADFDRQMLDLQRVKPNLSKELEPALVALRGAMKEGNPDNVYGFSCDELKKRLGDDLPLLPPEHIEEIEEALQPNLGADMYAPRIDEIRTELNIMRKQWDRLSESGHASFYALAEKLCELEVKSLRLKQNQTSENITEAIQKSSLQWIGTWLKICAEQTIGSFYTNRKGDLVLTFRAERSKRLAKAARLNIYLDATIALEDLAKRLEIKEEAIITCEVPKPKTPKLKRYQVENFGIGNYRTDDSQKRIDTTIANIRKQYPEIKDDEIAVIDHFKKGATYGWFSATRGTNQFKKHKLMFYIGTPIPHLGAIEAQRETLDPNGEIEKSQWQQYLIDAEYIQADGRTRAVQRLDEDIIHVFITNYELPFTTEKLNAAFYGGGNENDNSQVENIRRIFEAAFKSDWKQEGAAEVLGVSKRNVIKSMNKIGGWTLWKEFSGGCPPDFNIYISRGVTLSHNDQKTEELVRQWLPLFLEAANKAQGTFTAQQTASDPQAPKATAPARQEVPEDAPTPPERPERLSPVEEAIATLKKLSPSEAALKLADYHLDIQNSLPLAIQEKILQGYQELG